MIWSIRNFFYKLIVKLERILLRKMLKILHLNIFLLAGRHYCNIWFRYWIYKGIYQLPSWLSDSWIFARGIAWTKKKANFCPLPLHITKIYLVINKTILLPKQNPITEFWVLIFKRFVHYIYVSLILLLNPYMLVILPKLLLLFYHRLLIFLYNPEKLDITKNWFYRILIHVYPPIIWVVLVKHCLVNILILWKPV